MSIAYENEKIKINYKALSPRVLFVAKFYKNVNYWKCFVDSVEGRNFDKEYISVLNYGTSVSEIIAKLLFPEFKDYEYRE